MCPKPRPNLVNCHPSKKLLIAMQSVAARRKRLIGQIKIHFADAHVLLRGAPAASQMRAWSDHLLVGSSLGPKHHTQFQRASDTVWKSLKHFFFFLSLGATEGQTGTQWPCTLVYDTKSCCYHYHRPLFCLFKLVCHFDVNTSNLLFFSCSPHCSEPAVHRSAGRMDRGFFCNMLTQHLWHWYNFCEGIYLVFCFWKHFFPY